MRWTCSVSGVAAIPIVEEKTGKPPNRKTGICSSKGAAYRAWHSVYLPRSVVTGRNPSHQIRSRRKVECEARRHGMAMRRGQSSSSSEKCLRSLGSDICYVKWHHFSERTKGNGNWPGRHQSSLHRRIDQQAPCR